MGGGIDRGGKIFRMVNDCDCFFLFYFSGMGIIIRDRIAIFGSILTSERLRSW